MHPFMTFPANSILDKFGIRRGVVYGVFLATLGVWLRVLINWHFYFVFLGMAIAGIARPFIINA